jgi:hypothetical protein
MYNSMDEQNGLIPLERAIHEFDQLYNQVNAVAKIKMKCWLYYCQGRASGGKLCVTFDVYDSHMRAVDYIEMVRGLCVDVSDIGGLDNAVIILCQWYGV